MNSCVQPGAAVDCLLNVPATLELFVLVERDEISRGLFRASPPVLS